MSSETDRHLIHVRVIRHLPLGLSVELDNGQHGIVRIREISWNSQISANWKKNFPVGWKGTAVSISSKNEPLHELSLRLAEKDPWDDLPEEINPNESLLGLVTGVAVYGAFIDIGSGLTGLLHQSQLPAWVKTPPLELFWPNDRVRVCIRSLSREERHLGLGLPPVSPPPGEAATDSETTRGPDDLDDLLARDLPRLHILLVEDEPEQAAATASWLRLAHQRVETVGSAEQALEYLEKTLPDLALIDVGLPKMDGAKLAHIILEKWPQVRVINTTDWARAGDMSEVLDELQSLGAETLSKPFLFHELVDLLAAGKSQDIETPTPDSSSLVKLVEAPGLKSKRSIQSLLQQCRKHLEFEQALLFSIDPVHRSVSITEHAGEAFLDRNAIASLIFSPVRDVAEDLITLEIEELQAHDRDRFNYLLDLSPNLTACIGVPVPAQLQLNYALFLMDRHSKKLTREHRIYAEAMALAIGVALEQENFKEKSVLLQRTALIGQLTRGMVHEINNLVGPLSSRLDNLQFSLKKLEENPNRPDLQEARSRLISSELVEIQKNVHKIITTSRIFGNIAARGQNRVLRVDEIVSQTIHLLSDMANRSHITLVFSPPEQLIVIRSQAAALEQVLLNVMLNASQQIAELRPESGGWLRVSIEPPFQKTTSEFFRILIEDNGPGIHSSLWERIFEPGYTTRTDGSGIGLYISRNLLESIGGRLYVLESRILDGTTFALEIPAHL